MAKLTRGWGEGAIFKRSDGRWYAVLSRGTDGIGRRIRKELRGKSKIEVQQETHAATERSRAPTTRR